MKIRTNSLHFRLLASTALLVAIVLPLTALALTSYYRSAVEQTFDQRLKVHLDNLVAVSLRPLQESDEVRNGADKEDELSDKNVARQAIELGEPLFKRPFSGWYWQITALDDRQNSTVISDSLLDQRIASVPGTDALAQNNGLRRGYVSGPEGQILRTVEQLIIAGGEEEGGKGERFSYLIAISSSELDGQVSQFRNMLFLALGLLGLGLLLAGLMQVRYGLAPLFVISRKLNEIRAGKADHLQGQFPAEIEPLQKELNALIRSNREIVERARTHVGNLAHALKTPLSVISNEVSKAEKKGSKAAQFAENIGRQTQLMTDQVSHHLDRARMAAQTRVIGSATPVKPVINSLSRALQKIYANKDIKIVCNCEGRLQFRGEKQDLEEMLGNLLDNAFKWAKSEVALSVRQKTDQSKDLLILVEDDGPGLSADKRARAMQRGQRLDENLPGSGLGLSIVADLAHLYEGKFRLDTSKTGGLRAELQLPVAKI